MKWIGWLAMVLVFGAGVFVGLSRRPDNGPVNVIAQKADASRNSDAVSDSYKSGQENSGVGSTAISPAGPYSPQSPSDTNPVSASRATLADSGLDNRVNEFSSDIRQAGEHGSGDAHPSTTSPPPGYPLPIPAGAYPTGTSNDFYRQSPVGGYSVTPGGGSPVGPTYDDSRQALPERYPLPTTGGGRIGPTGPYSQSAPSGAFPVTPNDSAMINPPTPYSQRIPPATYPVPASGGALVAPYGAYSPRIPSRGYRSRGGTPADHDHHHHDEHRTPPSDHVSGLHERHGAPAPPPTPKLQVTISDAPISENGGATAGTVSRGSDTSGALMVALSSNDDGEATVPSSVTIPHGRTSANFTITGVDDGVGDGTRTVSILAAAEGFIAASDTVDVLDDEVMRQFDFGARTSPVRAGYTRVTGATTYSRSRGYGWSDRGVQSVDRRSGSEMERDLNYRAFGTFVVDVPIGTYDVRLTVGDKGRYRHDQLVFLEGAYRGSIATNSRQVVTQIYQNVVVADGQLTLYLDGRGGVDPNMAIIALQVAETVSTPSLHLAIADDSISENGGSTTGTVTRTGDTTGSLLVSLSSDDAGEATAPSTVTIASGQSSANFTINAVDDSEIDRTETVTISATASGLADSSAVLYVSDDEVAPFSRRFDFGGRVTPLGIGYTRVIGTTMYNASRGYGWSGRRAISVDRGAGTSLTRDFCYAGSATFVVDVPAGTYEVELIAGDTGGAPRDQTVFLEGAPIDKFSTDAGQTVTRTYSNFVITDGQLTLTLDGRGGVDRNMVINALDVTATALTPTLSIALADPAIPENGGSTTGTVTRTGDTAGSLLVNLFSDDHGEATAPSSVTIDGGQSSANFTIHAVDDGEVDGTEAVTILASATGLIDGSAVLNVSDDELAPFSGRFDFGGRVTPLGTGYTRVIGTDMYSESRGYGWFGGRAISVDRGAGTSLTRDFCYAGSATFVVDVPVGTYEVELIVGDTGATPHDQTVFLEGASIDTIATKAGQTLTRTYSNVVVSDGQLTLTLDGSGGVDRNMVINALDVTATALTPTLAIAIADDAISENGGSTTAIVSRTGDNSGALLVNLTSSNMGEATVPSTVTIAGGQSSATVTINAVDEGDIDGTQAVTILATASGHVDGSDSVDVLDDDVALVAD